MKIALAPVKVKNKNITFNMSQIKHYMQQAKENNAILICFGESYLQGFNCLTWNYDEDCKIAISTHSPKFQLLLNFTKDIGIDLLIGFYELDNNSIYSSCALLSNGKIIHKYRRISEGWKNTSKADEHYKDEDRVTCFAYHDKEYLLALCGDVWDQPERFSLGQDLFFWLVYVGWTKAEWNSSEKNAYVKQAKCCCKTTLYVNSICTNNANGGAALLMDGTIQAKVPMNTEKLLIVEINDNEN